MDVSILTARTIVSVLLVMSFACAPARMQLPTGPSTPVRGDEISFVYFDGSRQPCALEPLTALASIQGTINGHPIEGQFSFAASVNRLRLESVGRIPRDFVFVAEEARETFVYRGNYRFQGKSADVIETILGLPLKAEDLRRVLTGCPRISGSVDGLRYNDRWFAVRLQGDTTYEVFAERTIDGLGFTIRAIAGQVQGTTTRWRAEYFRDAKGLPRSVRVVSTTWNAVQGTGFDVRIAHREVHVNAVLAPETFTIGADPTMPAADLDALRRSRPASAPFLIAPRVPR